MRARLGRGSLYDGSFCVKDTILPPDAAIVDADYDKFGPSFFVPVPIEREPLGRIFWLNLGWFRSYGASCDNEAEVRALGRRLLDAFSIRTRISPAHEEAAVARADRYGGTGGTAHGGSGRCVYLGRFNVKGIGRTPLVARDAETHCDGVFLLTEGIRGAIYAELAHLESMHGAIRTVALIEVPPFNVPPEQRACLAVRPNFVRPAHLERSLLFGTAGFKGSDQYEDHKRVMAVRAALPPTQSNWLTMASNIAEEVGSLDAMRMSQGRFTSSNVSIRGEIADFETFRVFDTWHYVKNVRRDGHPFGKDLDALETSAVHWSRLGIGRSASRGEVRTVIHEAHRRGFTHVISDLVPNWGGKRTREAAALTRSLFDRYAAASSFSASSSGGWLLDGRVNDVSYFSLAANHAQGFGFSAREATVIAARLVMWRRPRNGLFFDAIRRTCEGLVGSRPGAARVGRVVGSTIASGRRRLVYPSDDMAPVFSFVDGERSCVAVVDTSSGKLLLLRFAPSPCGSVEIQPWREQELRQRVRRDPSLSSDRSRLAFTSAMALLNSCRAHTMPAMF